MDVMIDLETLGTRPDAAIIQIGAVAFEPFSGGKIHNATGFNRHVLVQDNAGSIDHSTIAWWLQEASAKKMGKEMEEVAVPLLQALDEFDKWTENTEDLSWDNIGGVWASPSDFDLPILKSAYVRFGLDVPWVRRATRDARTLFAITGGKPVMDWTGFTAHDAFDDAVGQAMQVQMAMGLIHNG